MAKIDEMRAELDAIRADVANVSADLDDLIGQLAGGVSPEDAAAFVAELTAVKEALDAVAAKHVSPGETP